MQSSESDIGAEAARRGSAGTHDMDDVGGHEEQPEGPEGEDEGFAADAEAKYLTKRAEDLMSMARSLWSKNPLRARRYADAASLMRQRALSATTKAATLKERRTRMNKEEDAHREFTKETAVHEANATFDANKKADEANNALRLRPFGLPRQNFMDSTGTVAVDSFPVDLPPGAAESRLKEVEANEQAGRTRDTQRIAREAADRTRTEAIDRTENFRREMLAAHQAYSDKIAKNKDDKDAAKELERVNEVGMRTAQRNLQLAQAGLKAAINRGEDPRDETTQAHTYFWEADWWDKVVNGKEDGQDAGGAVGNAAGGSGPSVGARDAAAQIAAIENDPNLSLDEKLKRLDAIGNAGR